MKACIVHELIVTAIAGRDIRHADGLIVLFAIIADVSKQLLAVCIVLVGHRTIQLIRALVLPGTAAVYRQHAVRVCRSLRDDAAGRRDLPLDTLAKRTVFVSRADRGTVDG